MISVLLEMKNGEGLSEAVSAQIRQAFQVFSLAVSSRKQIDEAWTILTLSFPEKLEGTLERDGYS